MHLVVHRGVGGQNTLQGIMTGLDVAFRCETDLIWHDNTWWICHDFYTFRGLEYASSSLDMLLEMMTNRSFSEKCVLILDIKWDWIVNREDSWEEARTRLFEVLLRYHASSLCAVWLQYNHRIFLHGSCRPDSSYRTGFAVHAPMPIWECLDVSVLDFITINVNVFSIQDLQDLKNCTGPTMYVMGYTCPAVEDLPMYAHFLEGMIDGIVCDITNRQGVRDARMIDP